MLRWKPNRATSSSSLGYSWDLIRLSPTYDKAYLPATGGYVQWSAKMPIWVTAPGPGSCGPLSPNGAEMDIQEFAIFLAQPMSIASLPLIGTAENGSQIVPGHQWIFGRLSHVRRRVPARGVMEGIS